MNPAPFLTLLSRRRGFTPLLLSSTRWGWTMESILDAGGAFPDDAETVNTWSDVTGNGNHGVAPSSGKRPAYSAAGGPNGGGSLVFVDDEFRRTFASPLASPWMFLVWKPTGDTAQVVMDAATGGSRVYFQRTGAGLYGVNSGSSINNIAISRDVWHATLIDWGTAAVINNDNLRDYLGNSGSNSLADIVFGQNYIGGSNPMEVAEVWGGSGTLTFEEKLLLMDYARRKFALDLPPTGYFEDTFSRADTAIGAALGVADTGQAWQVAGTKHRILNGALTHVPSAVGGTNTCYFTPLIGIPVGGIEWEFSTRDLGGVDDGFGAVIFNTISYGSLTDFGHFVWSGASWRLERFTGGGPVAVVAERTHSEPHATGLFRLTINHDAGTVRVLDPDGVETVGDWDTETGTDLDTWRTQFCQVELLCGADPGSVLSYERVRVAKAPQVA